MPGNYSNEPMLDMFIFETVQLIEQLEQLIIGIERSGTYTEDSINEIFRIMHTIKGSSAMMQYGNISKAAHCLEDLFHFLRENRLKRIDCTSLTDIVLESADFIKNEVDKVMNGRVADGSASELVAYINSYLEGLKDGNMLVAAAEEKVPFDESGKPAGESIGQDNPELCGRNSFKAVICFEEGCEMENIRAFVVVNALKEMAGRVTYIPEDIIDNDDSIETIRKNGFIVFFSTDHSYEEMLEYFSHNVVFLKDIQLYEEENESGLQEVYGGKAEKQTAAIKDEVQLTAAHQSIISVNIQKLDKLMDLVGELVISEAMVLQNPDLDGLALDNFQKSARQLQKITGELQDTVMTIRMVPLSTTFQKMNRIVRDMSKKLEKEIRLEIIGEETEVDKNVIDHISDPLMHLIRNSIDHGIESSEERKAKGKPEYGTITLEAKNASGDVLIMVRDDGRGLSREKILTKARENGLINKPEQELSDKEVFSYIFLAGFSTKEKVTEFSGRGVGMDVVGKNIDAIGGVVSVDSLEGEGTTITLKIPLTLAIMNSMTISVGKSIYSVPIISIKESLKAGDNDIIIDPSGNEMIMIRGQCYRVLRLYEFYGITTETVNISEGIFLMVENDGDTLCIFADALIGKQEVVVKTLPEFIKRLDMVRGLSGCTLLGDGSISLILDIADLTKYLREGEMYR